MQERLLAREAEASHEVAVRRHNVHVEMPPGFTKGFKLFRRCRTGRTAMTAKKHPHVGLEGDLKEKIKNAKWRWDGRACSPVSLVASWLEGTIFSSSLGGANGGVFSVFTIFSQ